MNVDKNRKTTNCLLKIYYYNKQWMPTVDELYFCAESFLFSFTGIRKDTTSVLGCPYLIGDISLMLIPATWSGHV